LQEKYLLRRAFEADLPASVSQRVKQPYRSPDGISFFVDGKPADYVAELMGARSIDDAGLFDAASVGKLMQKMGSGKAIGFSDNMAFVVVLSTMLLHTLFVRGVSPAQLT
jgi:asparagine synthase (glutamine-hydrolysing)